jgi:hypothetical protein
MENRLLWILFAFVFIFTYINNFEARNKESFFDWVLGDVTGWNGTHAINGTHTLKEMYSVAPEKIVTAVSTIASTWIGFIPVRI